MSTENNTSSFNSVFLTRGALTDVKINQLANWGKKLMDIGAVKGTEGNLSCRSSLGFIITGTNIPLNAINRETVAEITGVVYGLNKHSVYVKGMVNPSRETLLHTQIYEIREDVNVIFHAHDLDVMKQAVKLGIPVTELEQPAGSQELAQEAIKLLKLHRDMRYFILKNHGVVALGASIDEAGKLIEDMHARIKKKK